jgi:hypothetical protein
MKTKLSQRRKNVGKKLEKRKRSLKKKKINQMLKKIQMKMER